MYDQWHALTLERYNVMKEEFEKLHSNDAVPVPPVDQKQQEAPFSNMEEIKEPSNQIQTEEAQKEGSGPLENKESPPGQGMEIEKEEKKGEENY